MIKKFGDYDKVQSYSDTEILPRGGYVCKIIDAKIIENNYGQSVKLAWDIAEGDQKDYYKKRFDSDTREDKKWSGVHLLSVPKDDGSERDGWTKRAFKTFTDALEDSNDNYHFDWDESKFKGKLIGFVINYRQYEKQDGSVGNTPNVGRVTSVQNIKDGKFKIPDDKLLKNHKQPLVASSTDNSGFSIPEETDEAVPF